MGALSDRPFGYLIAYGLPGFLLLWGLSDTFPQVATWMASASAEHAPTIASFLYSTVASFALGLLLDAISSNLSQVFYWTKWIDEPSIDDSKLGSKDVFTAFQAIIDNHYRYFQCYASCILVILAVIVARWLWSGKYTPWYIFLGAFVIVVVLLFSARDALWSYGVRAERLTEEKT